MQKTSRRRTQWIIGIVAVAFLFGAAFIVQGRASTRGLEFARVDRGDVVAGIEVTGELTATDSSSIGPPEVPQMWQFRIAMLAPEGSDARKGQPVIGFDASELERRLQEKQAERDSARSEIEKRQASLRVESQDEKLRLEEAQSRLRKSELKLQAPGDVVNANERREIELESEVAKREVTYRTGKLRSLSAAAREELRVLQAKLDAASTEVQRLESAIAAMRVPSPRDGTVVYVMDRGSNEKPKVGDTVWRGRTILQIPDLRAMIGSGEVDEADAAKVFAGQKAQFRIDAHPDRQWNATVKEVGRTVRRASNTDPNRTLHVKLDLTQTDPELMRPGMRFRGTLITAERRGVTRIPKDALFTSEDGPAVRRRSATGWDEVPIQIGVRGDEWVEVTSGVEPGDQVVVRRTSSDEDERA